MNRAAFLSGSLAAVSVRAALETVTTQFPLPNVEYAGFFVAQKRGFFARAGIRHGYLAGGPSLPRAGAVVAGADVGVHELEKVVDAVRAGHDLAWICTRPNSTNTPRC